MTRDEAIACLIDWADDWITQHSFSLMPVRAAAERAEYEEAKAALAEPVVTPQGRCQHQAADASLDCTMPAVLCEIHGGHDGCAAEIMRLQGEIAEPQQGCVWKEYDQPEPCGRTHKMLCRDHIDRLVDLNLQRGRREEREEIARALEAYASDSDKAYVQALRYAAGKVRDGSIRKWLPKEGE